MTGALSVSPDYFRAMGVRLGSGREFDAADGRPGNEVAIVNELFASTHWPGSSAIGRRIRLSEEADAPWLEVVGVSPPILGSESGTTEAIVYIPAAQEPDFEAVVVVRSTRPSEALALSLREEIRLIDPDMPLYDIRTVREALYLRNWPYRVF
jgi:hypothetical protein